MAPTENSSPPTAAKASVLETFKTSGAPFRTWAVLAALAVVCIAEFLFHLDFNSEIFAWQPHTLDSVNGAEGEVVALNGKLVRNEGITTVYNTYFFSGGTDKINLSYQLAVSRMFPPFVASLFSLVTPDSLSAVFAANLMLWIAAAWAAYGIGVLDFKSERLGLLMGLMVATSLGFIAVSLGVKTHLAGYSYFIVLLFLAGRLGVFEPDTPWRNYVALALLNAIGAFMNNIFLPFAVAVLVIGILRRASFPKLILVGLVPVAVTAFLRFAVIKMAYPGVHSADRTFSLLIKSALRHLEQGVNQIFFDAPAVFDLEMAGGQIYRWNGFWAPFSWITDYSYYFIFIAGIPFLVLSVAGLAIPFQKQILWAFGVLGAFFVVAFGVQTYWPTQAFQAYAVYSLIIGVYILAAQGIVNLSGGVAWAGKALGLRDITIRRAEIGTLSLLMGALIAYTNQHLVTGYLLDFRRFHAGFQLGNPYDWPFDILAW